MGNRTRMKRKPTKADVRQKALLAAYASIVETLSKLNDEERRRVVAAVNIVSAPASNKPANPHLLKMRNLNTTKTVKQLDVDVLQELRTMRRQGKVFARAGTIAKKLSCNSVQALGAMERVKHRL